MNIGILTHCVARNYGANLQALSTAMYLKRKGYKPIFLKWNAYINEIQCSDQSVLHENFLEKYGFIVTNTCHSNEDFIREIERYKIKNIIVGSDCVLTMEGKSFFPYTIRNGKIVKKEKLKDYEFPNPFWLEYIKDRKDIGKFFLSASSGTSNIKNIPLKTRDQMRDLLDRFDFVSVRDLYTKKLIKEKIGVDKSVVLSPDPVFGFNDKDDIFPTEENIRRKYSLPDKYVVVSFYEKNLPNKKWFNNLRDELAKKDMEIVYLPMPQGGKPNQDIKTIGLPLDPMDWYSIIKFSNGYIGNNMHPIIVSIHNIVPFFSIDIHGKNYIHGKLQITKNSKETQLLTQLGLLRYHTSQMLYKYYPISKMVKNILNFDYSKCSQASNILKEKFNDTINIIIDNFKP